MLPEVDTIMEAAVQADAPGAAVAVVEGGDVVHRKGYGLANLEWRIPIEPDTVFRLASITKQFTATGIMLLQDEGKLCVDDSLTKFFPDYPTSGHEITIHHLLTHTSGIRSYTAMEGFLEKTSRQDMSTEALMNLFKREPFDFKPGAQYQYNNSGYFLLGMIIEKASGMSYADFIQKRIFEPLGMKQSCYLSNEPIIPKRASGYVPTEGGFANAPFMSMTLPYAAGSLGSTVDDLVLWDKALRGNTLVSAETLAAMHTPVTLNDGSTHPYGYGWGLNNYRDHRIVHHSGGINGFRTFMAHFFGDQLTIIILSNLMSFDPEKSVLAIARKILGLAEVVRVPFPLPSEALDAFVGSYLYSGIPLEVTKAEDSLILQAGDTMKLIPLSETSFYNADNPETEVHFEQQRAGKFSKMTLAATFNTIIGIRPPDKPSDG